MKAWMKKQLRKTWVVFVLLIVTLVTVVTVGKLFPVVVSVLAGLVILGCCISILWYIADFIAEEF